MTEYPQLDGHRHAARSVAEFLLAAGNAAISLQSITVEIAMQMTCRALAPVMGAQSDIRRQIIEAKKSLDAGLGDRVRD